MWVSLWWQICIVSVSLKRIMIWRHQEWPWKWWPRLGHRDRAVWARTRERSWPDRPRPSSRSSRWRRGRPPNSQLREPIPKIRSDSRRTRCYFGAFRSPDEERRWGFGRQLGLGRDVERLRGLIPEKYFCRKILLFCCFFNVWILYFLVNILAFFTWLSKFPSHLLFEIPNFLFSIVVGLIRISLGKK